MMRKLVVCLFALLMLGLNPATVFAAGGAGAVASCVACHGDKGNSMAPIFPKLAGQNEKYVAKQLHDFKLHRRKNPTMEGLAAGLSDDVITDIAAYYAKQKVQLTLPEPDDDDDDEDDEDDEDNTEAYANPEELIAKGRKIYLYGNLETNVPACTACHARDGMGNALAGFPVLKNQHATYLTAALKQFREGERSNDTNSMMRMSAKNMSTEEINAVSAYLANLK